MINHLHLFRFFRSGTRFGLLLAALGMGVQAATYTWDGGGGDGNWTTANNWSPNGAPARNPSGDGHDLVFSGTLNTTTWANSGGWKVRSLTFDSSAGAFTLGDGVLTIGTNGVTNHSTVIQTIANQITLGAHQTWTANTGAIISTGFIDANDKNLTLAGSSSTTISGQLNKAEVLTLSGNGNRTFGTKQVSATTLNINSTGTNTFGGQVNITTLNATAGTNTFANVQAGNGGITVEGSANATFTGPVTGGKGGITISSSGNIEFAGSINSGDITLNGTGITTISGSGNMSTGDVVVNNGTLILNHTGTGDAINNSLTVNQGGTVIFEGDNQIPAWETVTLNEGSTLYLGDTTQTFAELVITGDSVIDFGSGGSELNVTYGGISIEDGITITIVNWNEEAGDVFAGANPGAPVVNVQYADSNGNIYATGTWGGGVITPGTPIPEPATTGLLIIGGGIALVTLRRRRRAAFPAEA